MSQSIDERIKKIIQNGYNPTDQSLTIDQNIWIEVLLHRDWSMLRKVDLDSCDINDDNINNLFNLQWPMLQELFIHENNITVDGIKQLVKRQWPKLNNLKLSGNQNIRDEGFQLLIKNLDKFQSLTLDIGQCGLTFKSMISLTYYDLCSIKQLSINKNYIGSVGIKWLTKAYFPNLQILNLCHCRIGEEGYKHLTKNNWPKIRIFSFGTDIDINIKNERKENVWQTLYLNNWKKLEHMYVICQKQSICQMYRLLLQRRHTTLLCQCQIQNQQINQNIQKLLSDRGISQQQQEQQGQQGKQGQQNEQDQQGQQHSQN